MRVGICSGYFAPLHTGHCDYIEEAARDCDFLVVIVNNDIQQSLKIGDIFMKENIRLGVVRRIKGVDLAVLSKDQYDLTVVKTLQGLRRDFPNADLIFYNSGDRSPKNYCNQEQKICDLLNISQVFLPLKKVDSSRNYR